MKTIGVKTLLFFTFFSIVIAESCNNQKYNENTGNNFNRRDTISDGKNVSNANQMNQDTSMNRNTNQMNRDTMQKLNKMSRDNTRKVQQ